MNDSIKLKEGMPEGAELDTIGHAMLTLASKNKYSFWVYECMGLRIPAYELDYGMKKELLALPCVITENGDIYLRDDGTWMDTPYVHRTNDLIQAGRDSFYDGFVRHTAHILKMDISEAVELGHRFGRPWIDGYLPEDYTKFGSHPADMGSAWACELKKTMEEFLARN